MRFRLITAVAFESLQIDITVKLNNRRIIDGIFSVAGVTPENVRGTINSTGDIFDKPSWDEVKEMVEQKGYSKIVAAATGEFALNRIDLRDMFDS